MKFCKGCELPKEDKAFSSHKKTKDGLQYFCKMCHAEIRKGWAKDHKGERVPSKEVKARSKEDDGMKASPITRKKLRLMFENIFREKFPEAW